MARPFGRYELKAKIAQGGMAEVFLAVQRGPSGFEKLVAIKQLLPHLVEEPGFIEMFLDEARIAATLSHPNICQIFDLGVEQGRHYIAMEYLSGQSLARIWKKGVKVGNPMPVPLAAYAVARAAEGLAHAHERASPQGQPLKIVHRDVSPENLVVTYEGMVKVVDFGIAYAANKVMRTKTGVVRGKLSYMSPEQVEGKPIDARSDVWALGVVLHEVLAGRGLFRHDSDFEVMKQVLSAPIPSLAGTPGLAAPLAQVVDAALTRDLALRLPSARELVRRIDEALQGVKPRPDAEALAKYVGGLFAEERGADSTRVKAAVADQIDDFLFGQPHSTEVLTTTPEGPLAARAGTRALPVEAAPAQWRLPRWAWVAGAGVLLSGAAALAGARWWPRSPEAPAPAVPETVASAPGPESPQPAPESPRPAMAPAPAPPGPPRSR